MEYPPKTTSKIDFYIKASIGNREAIEAKKKDFEPEKKRTEERKKQ